MYRSFFNFYELSFISPLIMREIFEKAWNSQVALITGAM